jgi:outer membrane protein OmpA-like peptidoglycan-associated protein
MNLSISKGNEQSTRCSIRTKFVFFILAITLYSTLPAQVMSYTRPSWWWGVGAGANFNFYRGSTQKLNSDITNPSSFNQSNGIGYFILPTVEYHKPDTRLGFILMAGYDNRRSLFKETIMPCNCPAEFSSRLAYLTVEPNLRYATFKSNFYLFGGPRLAFNMIKSFKYQVETNPDLPGEGGVYKTKGDLSDVNPMLVSMQVGAGYDLMLSSTQVKTQWVLSPFISFQPYLGQSPRSIETMTLSTLRAGAILKFGRGREVLGLVPSSIKPEVLFIVNSPKNIPVQRRVRESFPLRNYVFFTKGSSEIPERYILLTKDQVNGFKADQLDVTSPKSLSGHSYREMVVYYNILNILGDRMQKNPTSSIRLVGSSENGPDEGKAMAESIKRYLRDIFGIEESRITTSGRSKPEVPSEKPGGTKELDLLREGDQRVSIESNSPALLMEFQSGPDAPLKPVEIITLQEAPLDSYITFEVKGADEAYTSWSLEVKDDKGLVQYFGPYTQEKISIPGKIILGARPEGKYTFTMVGTTKDGITEKKEATANLVLWTPPQNEEGIRFSVIFEFNESKTNTIYQKYLSEVVTPKIPIGATVIIHGHTDIIGDEKNNEVLSMARADEVHRILKMSLEKAGRKDVSFEIYGFGEDTSVAHFDNKFPEERFYNRTVIIDIMPKK